MEGPQVRRTGPALLAAPSCPGIGRKRLNRRITMPLLSKKYLRFDEDDVKLMQNMMKRFHEMHHGTGMPDYSDAYVGYLPVFAIALLASQDSLDRLTKQLVWLTRIVAFFTLVLTMLTLALLLRGL
jgi:hypothetical protein